MHFLKARSLAGVLLFVLASIPSQSDAAESEIGSALRYDSDVTDGRPLDLFGLQLERLGNGESPSVDEIGGESIKRGSEPADSNSSGVTPAAYQGACDPLIPCDLTGTCDTCNTCDSVSCGGCCQHGCPTSGCVRPAPCGTCPRINLANPYFNISLSGAVILDMLFNEARPVAPGTPFFLAPAASPGFDDNTFDMHARQSQIGAALVGPQFSGLQSGGYVLAAFYNDAVIVDRYGFLPLQAYGELKSDRWRFAAGLQFDVFSPRAPTVLPFSILNASGNAGNAFRGQVRLERYIRPSADRQWTIQLALSEPVATTIDPSFGVSEDNGWPNLEGRISMGCGCPAAGQRPFEIGVSGVVGQLRETEFVVSQSIVDVWGTSVDLYWKATDRVGLQAEVFTGQGLGTYNAGILQGINPVTLDAIETSGGFIECFAYLSDSVHTHFGYGVDDPEDSDVNFLTGRRLNETYFANLIWDVNPTFRVAGELAWRSTDWAADPFLGGLNNDSLGFHMQVQWRF